MITIAILGLITLDFLISTAIDMLEEENAQ